MDDITIRSMLIKLWNEAKGLEDLTAPVQEYNNKLYQKAYHDITHNHTAPAFKVLYRKAPAILTVGNVNGVESIKSASSVPIEVYGGTLRSHILALIVYVWDNHD